MALLGNWNHGGGKLPDGHNRGRPRVYDWSEIERLRNAGVSIKGVMARTGASEFTVKHVMRKAKEAKT